MVNREKLIKLTQEILEELIRKKEEKSGTSEENLVGPLLEKLKNNFICTEEIRQMYRVQTNRLVDIQNAVADLKNEWQCQKGVLTEKEREIQSLLTGLKGVYDMRVELERKLCYMTDVICHTEGNLQDRINAVQTSFTSQFGLLDRWLLKYACPRILKYILGLQILLVLLLGVGIMVVNNMIL